jgi:hypothetical protein
MFCDLFRAVDVVNIDLIWPDEQKANNNVQHHFESEIEQKANNNVEHHFESEILLISFRFVNTRHFCLEKVHN